MKKKNEKKNSNPPHPRVLLRVCGVWAGQKKMAETLIVLIPLPGFGSDF
jgi:hypothetical protein